MAVVASVSVREEPSCWRPPVGLSVPPLSEKAKCILHTQMGATDLGIYLWRRIQKGSLFAV
eukprot:819125-Lingulodinium_polyedra.AAC.1